MKWRFPHFMYNGILCSMAAFKQHCAFGFRKGALIGGVAGRDAGAAMGQFGRIAALSDLPPDEVLAGYVREAMRLNEAGPQAPGRSGRKETPEPAVPGYLTAALEENQSARATFERFSPRPLVVADGASGQTVSVTLDPAAWFRAGDGRVAELSQFDYARTGRVVELEMESGLRARSGDD